MSLFYINMCLQCFEKYGASRSLLSSLMGIEVHAVRPIHSGDRCEIWWCILPYHPALDHHVNKAVRAFNEDLSWRANFMSASCGVPPPLIRIAWRNNLRSTRNLLTSSLQKGGWLGHAAGRECVWECLGRWWVDVLYAYMPCGIASSSLHSSVRLCMHTYMWYIKSACSNFWLCIAEQAVKHDPASNGWGRVAWRELWLAETHCILHTTIDIIEISIRACTSRRSVNLWLSLFAKIWFGIILQRLSTPWTLIHSLEIPEWWLVGQPLR